METTALEISKKTSYIKPQVTRIVLDNSISLVMMTSFPPDPPPRPGKPPKGESKGTDSPFTSPFGDSPFE